MSAADPWTAESDRIERLLAEIEHTSSPQAWQRVEELVSRLVGLYGEGLGRLLTHAANGAPETLATRVAGDELLSSLLVLHGLHPAPTAERVARALDAMRPALATHHGDVELLGVREDGVVVVRLLGSCHGCASSLATLRDTVERAVLEAAPEVARVEVDGAELVQIGEAR